VNCDAVKVSSDSLTLSSLSPSLFETYIFYYVGCASALVPRG